MHDELCSATGQAFVSYVLGDSDKKELVEILDGERKKYDADFFGIKYSL